MATMMRMTWSPVTKEQYDEARERVNWEGDTPDGAIFHVSAFDGDTIHVTDVWESAEQFNRFAEERLMPVTSELGMNTEPQVEFYEVHAIFNPGVPAAA